MADDGKVPRATALEVLKACGVDSSVPTVNAGDNAETKLAKGSNPGATLNVFALPDMLDRRMIQHLSRKYDVPIHYFYNPDMVLKRGKSS